MPKNYLFIIAIQKHSPETLPSEGTVWNETVPLKGGTQNSLLKDLTMKFLQSCLHIDDVYQLFIDHPVVARFSCGRCPILLTPQLKSWDKESQEW